VLAVSAHEVIRRTVTDPTGSRRADGLRAVHLCSPTNTSMSRPDPLLGRASRRGDDFRRPPWGGASARGSGWRGDVRAEAVRRDIRTTPSSVACLPNPRQGSAPRTPRPRRRKAPRGPRSLAPSRPPPGEQSATDGLFQGRDAATDGVWFDASPRPGGHVAARSATAKSTSRIVGTEPVGLVICAVCRSVLHVDHCRRREPALILR